MITFHECGIIHKSMQDPRLQDPLPEHMVIGSYWMQKTSNTVVRIVGTHVLVDAGDNNSFLMRRVRFIHEDGRVSKMEFHAFMDRYSYHPGNEV